MKIIQPPPVLDSPLRVSGEDKVSVSFPLVFIKQRHAHHAAPSGFDRICDYSEGDTLRTPKWLYWLGETLLRPFCLLLARFGGRFEYSRYDAVQELALLLRAMTRRGECYFFVYAEKSMLLTGWLKFFFRLRGHQVAGAVHHMFEHHDWLFKNTEHFKTFDFLVTMDSASVSKWKRICGHSNVEHLPHGVDTGYFRPPENPPDETRVVFAGSHERDFDTLEACIKDLLRKANLKVDLVGRHSQLKSLQDRFEAVRLHQYLDDESYRRILQGASVLLLPLRASTVCNVVLEAMACGVPVVTNEGGIESYLDFSCGRVLPKGDSQGMTQAAFDLLSRPEIRNAARENARRFDWAVVTRFLHELLEASVSKDC